MELLQKRKSSEEAKNIILSLLIQFIWIIQNSTVDTQASSFRIQKVNVRRLSSCWIPVLVCSCIRYKTLHNLIWYIGNKTFQPETIVNIVCLRMCCEDGVIHLQLFKGIQEIVCLFCWISLDFYRPDSLFQALYSLACVRTLCWLNPLANNCHFLLCIDVIAHVHCLHCPL